MFSAHRLTNNAINCIGLKLYLSDLQLGCCRFCAVDGIDLMTYKNKPVSEFEFLKQACIFKGVFEFGRVVYWE